jgi:NAD+ diphosphatase
MTFIKEPNFFSGGDIDRAGLLRKDTAWVNGRIKDPTTRISLVWRDHHLIGPGDAPVPIYLTPDEARGVSGDDTLHVLLGMHGDRACFAIDISHIEKPEDHPELSARGKFMNVRDIGSLLHPRDAQLMVYSRALLYWHRRHGFCGICGSPTVADDAGHVRTCTNPDCAAPHFPRTDAAVIMLVIDGDRCLLGRRPGNKNFMYSTLAGFVEPGETLEEAVAREVMEEAGIAITNVRYAHSQPWPFPSNLMLGFYADATSTEITIQEDELADAQWFTRDQVKEFMTVRDQADSERLGGAWRLPRPVSIARRLIRDWLDGHDV